MSIGERFFTLIVFNYIKTAMSNYIFFSNSEINDYQIMKFIPKPTEGEKIPDTLRLSRTSRVLSLRGSSA